jgi:hypothetical protein
VVGVEMCGINPGIMGNGCGRVRRTEAGTRDS